METLVRHHRVPSLWGRTCRVPVAAERGADYDAGPLDRADAEPSAAPQPTTSSSTTGSSPLPSPAEQALGQLDAALAAVAAVRWSREDNDVVRAASVRMQRQVNQVSAAALAPLDHLQRREAYRFDGAVTAASWLRNRTGMDPATAARLCTAARRLRGLPLLTGAFTAGDVTYNHVTVVTEAAVPQRYDAISSVEATLVELARTAKPHSLRKAVQAVRDVADPDGSQPVDQDLASANAGVTDDDPRRHWQHTPTIDGLYEGRYLVGGILGELLTTMFDAYTTADPPDIPLRRRRSPAQKRVDAMTAALMALCDAGITPTLQGNKAHLLLMVDLLTLLGRDKAAVFASELRRTGRVSHATITRLGLNAQITPVFTMGRYRVVAVGQTHRTLPPWLRPMLEMIHRKCRGPDCDRPACWTQAHHQDPYAQGGNTDLNKTIPLCKAHHDLVTHHHWNVTLNTNTGTCTWTTPNGRIITTHP